MSEWVSHDDLEALRTFAYLPVEERTRERLVSVVSERFMRIHSSLVSFALSSTPNIDLIVHIIDRLKLGNRRDDLREASAPFTRTWTRV